MTHKMGEPELVREHAREVADISDLSKAELMIVLLRLSWQANATAALKQSDNPKRFFLPGLTYTGVHL